MYQTVNMYQPDLRLQPKLLSAATMMVITSVVMLLLLALYFSARSTMSGLQRTYSDLALNQEQFDAQLTAYSMMPALSIDVSVSDEISTLRAKISDRDALLNEIDGLLVHSKARFGDVFETLANTRLSGLWLTGIQLDHHGSIEVSGVTLDAKLVPQYLELITQQSLLATLNNGTVNLSRDMSNLPEISFVVSYKVDGVER